MLTKNIATMKAEVAAHIAADAVTQGRYWGPANNAIGGRGCFIGCLSHSNDASAVTERFGLPLPMVQIAECIFESLSDADARAFFLEVPEAIGSDGRDLSRTHWAFLADLLRHLPQQSGHVKVAVDAVIEGMDFLVRGQEWSAADAADAARAAAHAAYAASCAVDAADSASCAACAACADDVAICAAHAAYASAHAARAAGIQCQTHSFLAILRAA